MEKDENGVVEILHMLLNVGIVLVIFILLTIWMKNSKEGGADIARWGFQAVLYLVQMLIAFLFHRDINKRNLKPSFIGATIAFIIVFLIEIT